MVVPIVRGDRHLAQVDVDSGRRADFGAEDRRFLARAAQLLAPLFR
jgi:putative methionine-R-sulfoxide reductase with GAF domain